MNLSFTLMALLVLYIHFIILGMMEGLTNNLIKAFIIYMEI